MFMSGTPMVCDYGVLHTPDNCHTYSVVMCISYSQKVCIAHVHEWHTYGVRLLWCAVYTRAFTVYLLCASKVGIFKFPTSTLPMQPQL